MARLNVYPRQNQLRKFQLPRYAFLLRIYIIKGPKYICIINIINSYNIDMDLLYYYNKTVAVWWYDTDEDPGSFIFALSFPDVQQGTARTNANLGDG